MHKNCRPFVCAVAKKIQDTRIIQIFFANVISDLHTEVTGAHAAGDLGARGVNILQWNLAKRFQLAFTLGA